MDYLSTLTEGQRQLAAQWMYHTVPDWERLSPADAAHNAQVLGEVLTSHTDWHFDERRPQQALGNLPSHQRPWPRLRATSKNIRTDTQA